MAHMALWEYLAFNSTTGWVFSYCYPIKQLILIDSKTKKKILHSQTLQLLHYRNKEDQYPTLEEAAALAAWCLLSCRALSNCLISSSAVLGALSRRDCYSNRKTTVNEQKT